MAAININGFNIATTFGAILLGGLFASLLSGVVFVQVLLYYKMYPSDSTRLKALVLVIWFLDTWHTISIWVSLWNFFIESYGDIPAFDHIHWSLGLAIQFPAILILLVHTFFAQRIFKLSKQNYFLTIPIIILAIARCVAGFVASGYMMHLGRFSIFREEIGWIVTLGLGLSSAVDILVTSSLFVLLHTSRTGAATLDAVIDALIRYAFETASLTCAGTIASMLCWITLRNMIFLGLHFFIGKLYANSLLVTLNTRETIRQAHTRSSGEYALRIDVPRQRGHRIDSEPLPIFSTIGPSIHDTKFSRETESTFKEERVEVVVERNVQSDGA